MHSTAVLSRNEASTYDLRIAIEEAGGIEAMLRQGFLQVKYEAYVLAELTPQIMNGLRRMIDGPDRDAFAADIFGYDEVGWKHDSGLYRRNEREQKWFFHCYKETRERMHRRGAPVTEYAALFDAMEELNRRALEIAILVGKMFDEYHAKKGVTIPYSLAQSFGNGFCAGRALRYLARMLGKADATTHLDRDGVSVHFWGSRPGLIMFDNHGNQHRILETEFDTICIFFGKKFGGITDYAHGPGTLHGVVDTARESGATDDRFALVSFVHPKLTPEEAARILAYEPQCDALEKQYVL